MRILGPTVSHTGTPWSCCDALQVQLWRTFFRCSSGRRRRLLSDADRVRLLNNAMRPIIQGRAAIWSLGHSLAAELDRTQRRMTALLIRVRRHQGENMEAFWRRRGEKAKSSIKNRGRWSFIAASSILNWKEHLERERNSWTPASKLLAWHGERWLHQHRINVQAPGGFGTLGRTHAGHPSKRWEEGANWVQLDRRALL